MFPFNCFYNSDEGVGYSPFSLGKGYGEIVDPGFVPLPAFNPYGMFYGGWPHFGRQAPAPAPAPAPATCGKGPAAITSTKTLWPFLVSSYHNFNRDVDMFFITINKTVLFSVKISKQYR
jgi:hypothetical protein